MLESASNTDIGESGTSSINVASMNTPNVEGILNDKDVKTPSMFPEISTSSPHVVTNSSPSPTITDETLPKITVPVLKMNTPGIASEKTPKVLLVSQSARKDPSPAITALEKVPATARDTPTAEFNFQDYKLSVDYSTAQSNSGMDPPKVSTPTTEISVATPTAIFAADVCEDMSEPIDHSDGDSVAMSTRNVKSAAPSDMTTDNVSISSPSAKEKEDGGVDEVEDSPTAARIPRNFLEEKAMKERFLANQQKEKKSKLMEAKKLKRQQKLKEDEAKASILALKRRAYMRRQQEKEHRKRQKEAKLANLFQYRVGKINMEKQHEREFHRDIQYSYRKCHSIEERQQLNLYNAKMKHKQLQFPVMLTPIKGIRAKTVSSDPVEAIPTPLTAVRQERFVHDFVGRTVLEASNIVTHPPTSPATKHRGIDVETLDSIMSTDSPMDHSPGTNGHENTKQDVLHVTLSNRPQVTHVLNAHHSRVQRKVEKILADSNGSYSVEPGNQSSEILTTSVVALPAKSKPAVRAKKAKFSVVEAYTDKVQQSKELTHVDNYNKRQYYLDSFAAKKTLEYKNYLEEKIEWNMKNLFRIEVNVNASPKFQKGRIVKNQPSPVATQVAKQSVERIGPVEPIMGSVSELGEEEEDEEEGNISCQRSHSEMSTERSPGRQSEMKQRGNPSEHHSHSFVVHAVNHNFPHDYLCQRLDTEHVPSPPPASTHSSPPNSFKRHRVVKPKVTMEEDHSEELCQAAHNLEDAMRLVNMGHRLSINKKIVKTFEHMEADIERKKGKSGGNWRKSSLKSRTKRIMTALEASCRLSRKIQSRPNAFAHQKALKSHTFEKILHSGVEMNDGSIG